MNCIFFYILIYFRETISRWLVYRKIQFRENSYSGLFYAVKMAIHVLYLYFSVFMLYINYYISEKLRQTISRCWYHSSIHHQASVFRLLWWTKRLENLVRYLTVARHVIGYLGNSLFVTSREPTMYSSSIHQFRS